MSSRLERLLYAPDTKEWLHYKKKWLQGTTRLYASIALVIVIGVLGYVLVRYFQINTHVPKGIPEDYYVLSLSETYALVNFIAAEENGEVRFLQGVFEVYPKWQHTRYPATMLYCPGQGYQPTFSVRS